MSIPPIPGACWGRPGCRRAPAVNQNERAAEDRGDDEQGGQGNLPGDPAQHGAQTVDRTLGEMIRGEQIHADDVRIVAAMPLPARAGPPKIFQSIALRRTAGSVDYAMISVSGFCDPRRQIAPHLEIAQLQAPLAERVTPGDDCMAAERVGTLAHAPTASAVASYGRHGEKSCARAGDESLHGEMIRSDDRMQGIPSAHDEANAGWRHRRTSWPGAVRRQRLAELVRAEVRRAAGETRR